MANQPRTIQEELTQITDEFRVMHARVNGQTHAQAARPKGRDHSHKLQRAALTRWNCQTLAQYKTVHAKALRATMFQIRDQATKTDPNTLWGQQLAATHELLRLMHEQTPTFGKNSEHMRDATVRQIQGP